MKGNHQKIYEQLGYLFYAVAAADKIVRPAEIAKLRELVNRDWVPREEDVDEFYTDAAYYILIAFDYLLAEDVPADVAFDSFASYYDEHKAVFDPDVKRRIKRTASAVADAFAGTNKQEAKCLAQLNALLAGKHFQSEISG